MAELNSNILALIGQAVLVVRGGLVTYANPAAVSVFGDGCRGKKLAGLLGDELAAIQSPDFVSSCVIRGKSHTVHATRVENSRVFVLKEIEADCSLLNDSFLSAMRSAAMTLSISAELCRTKAEESGDKELLKALTSLNRSISVTSRLVSNISVARDTLRGELSCLPRNMDLSALCRNSLEFLSDMLPETAIRFDLPDRCAISADPDLLIQLLINILSNAILGGKCKNIRVRLREERDFVSLSVDDDGCGIRSDELGNVFDRYRVKRELTNIGQGVGLGLTVVRGIAERHGGILMIESREAHGTTVNVTLQKNIQSISLHCASGSEPGIRNLLVLASDFLPESCYSEKYMD